MNSFQLLQDIDLLLDTLDPEQFIRQSVQSIAAHYDPVLSILGAVAGQLQAPSLVSQVARAQQALSGTRDSINQLRRGAVFREISALEERLELFGASSAGKALGHLEQITEALSDFESTYEEYLDDRTLSDTLAVLVAAKRLHDSLTTMRAMALAVQAAIQPSYETPEGYEDLTIFLSSAAQLDEILLKLSAIRTLYDEGCELVGVSRSEYPLLVRKVESGSLLALLSGESAVIGLIVGAITSAAAYYHRSYTTEGKLSSGLPRKVDAVEKVLGLRQKLVASNIDTSDMDARIQKSSLKVAAALDDLLGNEDTVVINGITHSSADRKGGKALGKDRTLLLRSGDSDDTSTQE